MTVIYIDRVFALNLALDYMLLLICARLAGTPLRRLRFLLCAAGGALYAAAVFLPGCAALNGPVFRLLAREEVYPACAAASTRTAASKPA